MDEDVRAEVTAPEDTRSSPAAMLSPRVTYEEAAEMLCVSIRQLRRLIRDGEIPVIQPAMGRRGALIEVKALEDYLDRLRARANRSASHRAKSAARRGAA